MSAAHNMSDDEFLAAGEEAFPDEEEFSTEEVVEDNIEEEDTKVEDNNDSEDIDIEDTEDEEDSEEVDDTNEDTQDTDETKEDDTDDESQDDDTENDDDTEEDKEDDTEADTQETDDFDYKAFHDEVTKDYKANGKTMPGIKDPKDFITALSMASNYAQKTTAMKSHMGRIKMLQDVSDEDLNEMMDFRARDPELIKKAMVDAKIDPITVDLDEEIKYKANDYTVSQAEVEFDSVLDSIKDTPSYTKTSEVVTKIWDEKSRKAMLDEPRLIAALNEEMEMGRYDTIQSRITQDRSLGKNADKTDLELYQEIATTMNKEKELEVPIPKVDEKPKSKVEDPAVAEAKKKAGVSTKKKVKKTVKKYDPAKLSDDEFEKLMNDGAKFL